MIRAFSKHLIKNGSLSKDIGKFLNRAEEIRLIADYSGDPVELIDAHEIVKQAGIFVETLRGTFIPNNSD